MRVPRFNALRLSLAGAPPPWRRVAQAAAAAAMASASAIGLLAMSGWLITRASQRPPVFALSIAMGAVQAFALARGLSRYAERLAVHGVALDLLSRLRVWLYDTVEPLVPDALAQRGTGSVITGFVHDVEVVTESLARGVSAVIDAGMSIVIGAGIALVMMPSSGAVLLLLSTTTVVLAVAIARVARRSAETAAAIRDELADSVVDAVRSARELVVYGRRDLPDARLVRVHHAARRAASREAVVFGAVRGAVAIAATVTVVGVVLTGVAVHNGGRLSGVMLAVLVFVSLAVLDQVAALPVALARVAAGQTAARRLTSLAGLAPLAREPNVTAGPLGGAGDVALHRVRVGRPYTPHALPILHDVSFRVLPRQHVALVGESGSGKSTSLHVLLHFIEPSYGSATLDGTDVRTLTRAEIARRLAWLPETTHLFNATLADNLRIGNPSATSEECVAALTRVGLAPWYDALPGRLDTRLGADGMAVSAGERQRLGMARTLLCEAGTLLLDEPTAHLDPRSSIGALAALLDAARTQSAIVVSHDPSVAAVVDDVVTLSSGRVVPV